MANELAHKTVGTSLSQAEFEDVTLHVFSSQAAGDIPYASSTTQISRLGIGTAGQVLETNAAATAPQWANRPNANALINGAFAVAQRGTSFTSATTPANSDDTFLLDRWILLSDGNDIVDVTQESTVTPTGIDTAIKLEVETANKQFGILNILEAKDAAALIGGTASLSFQARMAAADDNTHSLKAVVLAWSSTADTVTSDVVDAWSATATYVANWTAENAPGSNTLTTSYQTFTITGISIDTASAANVAVFIYCDQTDGVVDDAIYITGVKLEPGSTATVFVPRLYGEEDALCKRYCWQMTSGGAYQYITFAGAWTGTTTAICFGKLPDMRTSPTMTYSSVGNIYAVDIAYVPFACSGLTFTAQSIGNGGQVGSFDVTCSGATATAQHPAWLSIASGGWVLLSAEL